MTDQLALCLDETAFDRFHADNPKVYETLVRLFDLRTSKADLWIAGAVA